VNEPVPVRSVMIEIGAFRLDLIFDGYFEDDADTFVRLCAERQSSDRVKPRAKSRIRVGFNSLLVRGEGRTVVVDPGAGDRPRPEIASRYHLEWPRRFLPTLRELGVKPEAANAVILTHLHWDHAGASVRFEKDHLVPAFTTAHYFVQKAELLAARAAVLAGDDSYNADDFEPLVQANCLKTVEDDSEILPGFTVRRTGGHSQGHQIVLIESRGQRAIYLSDLVPTSTQLPVDCVLSYDFNIDEIRAAKAAVLEEAFRRRDLLLFVHAPRLRAGYLTARAGDSYTLQSAEV